MWRDGRLRLVKLDLWSIGAKGLKSRTRQVNFDKILGRACYAEADDELGRNRVVPATMLLWLSFCTKGDQTLDHCGVSYRCRISEYTAISIGRVIDIRSNLCQIFNHGDGG